VKIEIDPEGLVVRSRQKNWEEAAELGVRYRYAPPDGYKLVRDIVTRRKQTGRAVNQTLEFDYVDDRVAPFSKAEAFEFFGPIELPKGPRPLSQENHQGGEGSA
jgi:hypothetical protein